MQVLSSVLLFCFISSSYLCPMRLLHVFETTFWNLQHETHLFVQHMCGSVFACAYTEHTRICTILLSVFKLGPPCVISEGLTICRRSLLPHRDLDSMAVANIQPAVFAQEHSLKSAVASVYTRAMHSCLTLLTSVGLKPWWRYLRSRSWFFSAALWYQQSDLVRAVLSAVVPK